MITKYELRKAVHTGSLRGEHPPKFLNFMKAKFLNEFVDGIKSDVNLNQTDGDDSTDLHAELMVIDKNGFDLLRNMLYVMKSQNDAEYEEGERPTIRHNGFIEVLENVLGIKDTLA